MAVRAAGGDEMSVTINLQLPGPVARATVTVNSLRVRETPGEDGKQVGSLRKADRVEVWGAVKGWTLVRRGELCGWSATRYLARA